MSILFVLFLCLALAYILAETLKFFKFPRVIGQLLAGVILGIPPIKAWLFDESSLSTFSLLANIGFILLLFFVGLEINLSRFRSSIEQGVFISIFKTVIPLALGFFAARLFGLEIQAALIVGIALSVSAIAISIDVLEELRILKSRFAMTLVSVNAINDMIELLIVAVVLALAKITVLKQGLYTLFIDILLFIVLIVLFKTIIVPFILKFVEKENSATSLFAGATIIAVLMAALSEILGLGSLIGALLAGMIVRKTLLGGKDRRPWEEHEIAKMMHTLTFGLLAPLFFIYVGLKTNFSDYSNWSLSILLVGLAILGAIIGTLLGNFVMGQFSKRKVSRKESMMMGWGLVAKGDTDLIIAVIALQNGLISDAVFTSLVFMGIATTLIAVSMFRYHVSKECKYFKIC